MRLKDLAEHLGLSQTTVSRALNGYPEVNETTRLRVCAGLEQSLPAKALGLGGYSTHVSKRFE